VAAVTGIRDDARQVDADLPRDVGSHLGQCMATRSRLHKPPYTLTHPPIRPLRSRHERTSESSESAASFIWGGLVTKFYTYPEPTRVSVRVCNRTGPIKILHFGLFGRFLMCAIGSKLTSPFRATERRIISNALQVLLHWSASHHAHGSRRQCEYGRDAETDSGRRIDG
jgi:hypothetical protein